MPNQLTDAEKIRTLVDAGWTFGKTLGLWFAPNCTCGQRLAAAWQSYLLGKRCEEPLVKEPQ
jgi:hypothetical protein